MGRATGWLLGRDTDGSRGRDSTAGEPRASVAPRIRPTVATPVNSRSPGHTGLLATSVALICVTPTRKRSGVTV